MLKKSTQHPIKLIFVILGELTKVSWVLSLPILLDEYHSAFLIYFFLLIIFAILQTGVSDNFGRKSVLQQSFIVNFIAQIFLICALILGKYHPVVPYLIYPGLIITAVWSNIEPLSRASLTDENNFIQVRWLIPMSLMFLSPCWMVWINNPIHQNSPNFLLLYLVSFNILAATGTFFWIWRKFIDFKDEDISLSKEKLLKQFKEINLSSSKIKLLRKAGVLLRFELNESMHFLHKDRLLFLIAIFHQIGFQLIFYSLVEKKEFFSEGFVTKEALFIGFMLGVVFQPSFFINAKLSALIGVTSCFCFSLWNILGLSAAWFQGGIGFGAGLFLASFYCLLVRKERFHVRGKLIGIGDATQTNGELFVSVVYLIVPFLVTRIPKFEFDQVKNYGSLIFFFVASVLGLYYFIKTIPKKTQSALRKNT